MKTIPFNINLRSEIESGKYKVLTKNGNPARIICWDRDNLNGFNIVALVTETINGATEEYVHSYNRDGKASKYGFAEEDFLSLVNTQESELTKFESAVAVILNESWWNGLISKADMLEKVKEYSAQLLKIAKKELESEKL